MTTGASREITSAAVILYAPVIAACLLWVVWHWRNEMAAWLSAMVSERKIGRQLKLDTAHRWWMFGLAFYALLGLAAVYAALTESDTAARGLSPIESVLIALLLFETLMHGSRATSCRSCRWRATWWPTACAWSRGSTSSS